MRKFIFPILTALFVVVLTINVSREIIGAFFKWVFVNHSDLFLSLGAWVPDNVILKSVMGITCAIYLIVWMFFSTDRSLWSDLKSLPAWFGGLVALTNVILIRSADGRVYTLVNSLIMFSIILAAILLVIRSMVWQRLKRQ